MSRFRKLVLPVLLLLIIGLGFVAWRWLFAGLPDPQSVMQRLATPSVRITDRNGRLLYDALPAEGGRHSTLPLAEISLALQQATLATEDLNFYQNPGFDLRGILRAVWIDLRGGQALAGGSTITQQVARTLLLSAEERSQRSIARKLREIYLAWRLNQTYSKEEILALYLNQTYYGAMSYGVEAAAQTYFGKHASQLDLAESALIAGLPQAPSSYNPYTDMPSARKRQAVVLHLMQSAGFITSEQEMAAEREPLVLASAPFPILAPHFVMMVRSQVDAMFSLEEIYAHGGIVVRTTLDLDWQMQAEQAIARQIEALHQGDAGLGHNVNNAALVAIDPRTGEIKALVGSPDYFDAAHGGAINMALAPRQPGSALKPLVYAAAFDPTRPSPWTAATMLLDVRTSFVTHEGRAYIPEDYDRLERGPVLAREALASSLNIPAVLTLEHIGLADLFKLASRLGITSLHDPQQYDLSLALGGGEVRLIDLTSAYGAFANGGYRVTPFSILEVRAASGERLYQAPAMPKEHVLDERVAWLISDILSDENARLRGFGPNTILQLDRPAAVKTGTTSNFHDNWTVGYTPSLVVGVWAGNTNYEPMREVNGLTGAAPVWHQFMRAVLSGQPQEEFKQPQGLVHREVCALSGLLPTPACPYRRLEWFIAGTQPTRADTIYRQVWIDRLTGSLADEQTPPAQRLQKVVLDLPPQAQPWARAQGLSLLSDLMVGNSVPGEGAVLVQGSPVRLISPASGSIYNLAPGFDPATQQLRVEAVGVDGMRQVTLYVDGVVVGTPAKAPYAAFWQLTPGKHTAWVEAVLASGQHVVSEKITFEVKS